MQKNLLLTKDGSHTISVPSLQATYHSIHGAIQESMHVFIEMGLREIMRRISAPDPIRVFEMGFGTGLNALLTLKEALNSQRAMYYEAVEAFPLEAGLVRELNYCGELNDTALSTAFELLHSSGWDKTICINPLFEFRKTMVKLETHQATQSFHLIYYDAFAPGTQPELWTTDIFIKLFSLLEPGGLLVTYCSKGAVRRNLQAAGFSVSKVPGPPGKREMLRACRQAETAGRQLFHI